MKLILLKIRDTIAETFWFLPALMAFLAVVLALGTVAIDHEMGSRWVRSMGWVWSGGADGARGVLSVIAASVMTVVSIVFSMTVTTLAQTSSHFGPRVLRNFTSDRGVQFTLGTYISTFVYCLLVLRTVRSNDDQPFVPYLAVNIGVVLALGSLAVLIFFIHRVTRSIQAENLIAEVGEEFQATLHVLFPEQLGESQPSAKAHPAAPAPEKWAAAPVVPSASSGYLQRVDDARLLALAQEHDAILRLEKRPGDFVAIDSPLLRFLAKAELEPGLADAFRHCFSLGRLRTPFQDPLYPIQQLVEIAGHALSPGINEPFTALTCIDWLGTALRGVARRRLPEPLRIDETGTLRVVALPLSFPELASAIFDQIRLYCANSPTILGHLLQMITEVAPDIRRPADRATLRHHARQIKADASQILNLHDRKRVIATVRHTLLALSPSPSPRKSAAAS